MSYCNRFILGQIIETSTLLKDISTQNLKDNEVKMIRHDDDRSGGEKESV